MPEKLGSSSFLKFWTRYAIVLMAWLIASSPVDALDTNRALTQALHRVWQVRQGLPQPTIFSVCQTGNDYIWLGTPTGLVRFDGSRFSVVNQFKGFSLEHAWIRVVTQDAEHHLWFSISGVGVVQVRDQVAHLFDISRGLPSNNVRCLAADPNGGMWVGTDKGLAHIAKDEVTSYGDQEGLTQEVVTALAVDDKGAVFIGSESNKIAKFVDHHFTWIKFNGTESFPIVTALWVTKNGSIWIGTNHGLIRWLEGVEKIFTTEDNLASNWINSITGGRGGVVWVGTKAGFSLINERDRIQTFGSEQGLSQSTVYSMTEDHEGNLWVATKHGLNQFVDRRALPITESEGLPSNRTGAVCQSGDGTIWIGTLGEGICHYDDQFIRLTTKEGLAGNEVFTLAAGEKNDLWVGTDGGICCIANQKVVQVYTEKDGLSSNRIRCLLIPN